MMGDKQELHVKLFLTLLSLRCSSVAIATGATPSCDPGDRTALLEFKAGFLLNTNPTASWTAGIDCCRWEGVNCTSSGRVRDLEISGPVYILDSEVGHGGDSSMLANSSYTAVVGESLGNLSALEKLSLVNVYFNGPLPSSWGRLAGLRYLALIQNNFSGSHLPEEISQLSNLQTLIMIGCFRNTEGWQIPKQLCNLTKLEEVTLPENGFSGEIPQCVCNWTSVETVFFSGNNFTGSIPSCLGNLTELVSLNLDFNRLSGTIPKELGQLSKLVFLDLGNNRLSGEIPQELADASALVQLILERNFLEGQLPAVGPYFRNLSALVLSSNRLTGRIPPELGLSTKISILLLDDNMLTGNLPPELGAVEGLNFCVQQNLLSGPIPATYSRMITFIVHSNLLSGDLPLSLLNVTTVDVARNRLTFMNIQLDMVPRNPKILSLDLSSNHIEAGPVPEWLFELRLLKDLRLADNNFNAAIPWLLLVNSSLTYLDLSSNNFSSDLQLPQNLPVNSEISVLSLKDVGLRGPIPASFLSSVPDLFMLTISHNKLSGNPAAFCDVDNSELHYLDISYNELTGEAPRCLHNSTKFWELDYSHNHLSG